MSFYFIKLDYYYFLEAFYTKLIFTAFKKTFYIVSIKICFLTKFVLKLLHHLNWKLYLYIYINRSLNNNNNNTDASTTVNSIFSQPSIYEAELRMEPIRKVQGEQNRTFPASKLPINESMNETSLNSFLSNCADTTADSSWKWVKCELELEMN